MPLWAVATLGSGAFLAAQARMNGELSRVWGHGLDAALWSFGSGLAVMTVLALLSRSVRAGAHRLRAGVRANEIPLWQCLGGIVGAVFVFAQAYAVPVTGVAVFSVASVGGQTASAVVVDRLGLGPRGRLVVSWVRVLAAVLAPVGVVVAVGGRVSATSTEVVLPAALVLLASAFVSVQQGTNGRVTVVARNAMTTPWLNFATGTVTLLVLALPAWALGWFGAPQTLVAPWWAWFGGPCGIVVVTLTALSVRHLGVLLVILLLLAGQLGTALVLDALNPATRGQVTPVVVLGLVVTVAAAVLAAVAATRSSRRAAAAVERDGSVAG